eukprot:4165470-Alexandrium_andersonii.AAC.1
MLLAQSPRPRVEAPRRAPVDAGRRRSGLRSPPAPNTCPRQGSTTPAEPTKAAIAARRACIKLCATSGHMALRRAPRACARARPRGEKRRA